MAFDVITPTRLARTAIPTSTTVVYTVPVLTRTMVKDIDICNTSTSGITVAVYLGSVMLVPSVTIKRNGYYQWTGSQMLDPGETISAVADIAGATLHISGGECV